MVLSSDVFLFNYFTREDVLGGNVIFEELGGVDKSFDDYNREDKNLNWDDKPLGNVVFDLFVEQILAVLIRCWPYSFIGDDFDGEGILLYDTGRNRFWNISW